MDIFLKITIDDFIFYFSLITLSFAVIKTLINLVVWSKKMSKGALFFLAIFPIISIFPIPQQEIKKIENIKKEYIKKVDENGEPLDDSEK
ncbi:hypothetical protein GNP35_05835 [Psychrosphaera haliotis]|uniref:Uncharacterized protein n=2 Tax=Psychrosphaera haliotis TaxID=555083 RepID=A0A6N8FCF0_9GAMM|nr:hypothetical protein [Psychrosphaera haliotis]